MRKLFSLIAAVLFAGSMFAADFVSTLTFTAACGGTGTADNGAVWTVTSDAAESTYDADRGIHYGTSSKTVQYVQLETSDIKGTVKKVVVNASDATASATATVTVGETAFTCKDATVTNSNPGVDYEFTGSAEGAIVVRIDRGEAKKKALYVKSVVVTYEAAEVPATGIALDQKMLNLVFTQKATLKATVTPEGATTPVEWKSTNEEVATVANGTVTGISAGEVEIIASAGEGVADTCFVLVTAPALSSCLVANGLAENEVTGLKEVVVTYVQGGNIYIKDETGGALIFAYNYGLQAGDTIKSGFIGISSPYNGLPELKPNVPFSALEIAKGPAPEPEELKQAPEGGEINKYLILKGLTVEAGSFTTQSQTNLNATFGLDTFIIRNNFKLAQTFEEGKKYDVVGFGAVYIKNEETTFQLYFLSATESEEKPVVEPIDTVGIALSKGLFFFDYTSDPEEGWWDLYGSTEGYEFEFSNIFAQQAEGVYTINDLDPDYTYIVPTETGDTVRYTDGQLVLITVNDTVLIAAELLGTDTVLYRFSLKYTDPVAEDTVVVEIPEATLYDKYAEDGLYVVYGSTEDEATYVQLAISADEGFQGEFTEADFDYEISSFIETAAGDQTIYTAAITVTPGNGEGVYKVEADLLCYNNTLYKVTMQIGDDEEGVEETEAAIKAIKAIKNGQIIIEKNGVKYNVLGTRL